MKQLDLSLFAWLSAGLQPDPWVLACMSALAVGGPWVCILALAWVVWRRPTQRLYVTAVLVASAAAAMLAHGIAAALDMPRPFMLGLSPAYIPHGARGTLPSAHASVMFTVAAAMLLRPGLRAAGTLAALAALSTGWARVYVGVHFPLDIAAGLLLGMAVAGALWLSLKLWHLLVAPMRDAGPRAFRRR